MRNHSYENELDLHENENACRTHFHMKGFALRPSLKQSHKRTRNGPIGDDLRFGDDLRAGIICGPGSFAGLYITGGVRDLRNFEDIHVTFEILNL